MPLHCVMHKSSLSTSFPTVCPSASKTIGLPGWSRVEHRKCLSTLILESTYRLVVMAIKLKECNDNYNYLPTARNSCIENKLWQGRRLNKLTCMREKGEEGLLHIIRWLSSARVLMRYNYIISTWLRRHSLEVFRRHTCSPFEMQLTMFN